MALPAGGGGGGGGGGRFCREDACELEAGAAGKKPYKLGVLFGGRDMAIRYPSKLTGGTVSKARV